MTKILGRHPPQGLAPPPRRSSGSAPVRGLPTPSERESEGDVNWKEYMDSYQSVQTKRK